MKLSIFFILLSVKYSDKSSGKMWLPVAWKHAMDFPRLWTGPPFPNNTFAASINHGRWWPGRRGGGRKAGRRGDAPPGGGWRGALSLCCQLLTGQTLRHFLSERGGERGGGQVSAHRKWTGPAQRPHRTIAPPRAPRARGRLLHIASLFVTDRRGGASALVAAEARTGPWGPMMNLVGYDTRCDPSVPRGSGGPVGSVEWEWSGVGYGSMWYLTTHTPFLWITAIECDRRVPDLFF